jgi:two-component system sensor histidine kinase PilS (NtrC family)
LGLLLWSVWVLKDNPEILLSVRPQFYLAATAFFFMGVSAGLAPRFAKKNQFIWSQMFVDAIFVSALLSVDGLQSPLFILYSLNILGAVRLLSARGVLFVSFLDAISFLFVVFYGGLYQKDLEAIPDLFLYTQIVFRVFGLLLVGVLASSLAQRQAETQRNFVAQVRQTQQLSLQHQSLLKRLPLAMFLVDDGVISFQNAASIRYFGEVNNKDIDNVLDQQAEHWELEWSSVAGSGLLEARTVHLDEHRTVFLFEDVTVLRAMEAKSLRETRLAAVGRLAASLAHEIRNPLASLSGAAQLLEEGQKNKLHTIILREVKRINELVEDFLQSARPPSLKRRFVVPEPLIFEVMEAFSLDPRGAHLEVKLDLSDDNMEVFIDEKLIRQVLWNLIINAAYATQGGDILFLKTERIDQNWVMYIADTGSGIEPELCSKIFDPFVTMRSGGTGLGLATVERIVQGHGGEITVESTVGVGSTFQVFIPLLRS